MINFDLKTTDSFDNENYFFYKVDVSKKTEVEDQVAKVYRTFGKIDGLVNNAGIALPEC